MSESVPHISMRNYSDFFRKTVIACEFTFRRLVGAKNVLSASLRVARNGSDS